MSILDKLMTESDSMDKRLKLGRHLESSGYQNVSSSVVDKNGNVLVTGTHDGEHHVHLHNQSSDTVTRLHPPSRMTKEPQSYQDFVYHEDIIRRAKLLPHVDSKYFNH